MSSFILSALLNRVESSLARNAIYTRRETRYLRDLSDSSRECYVSINVVTRTDEAGRVLFAVERNSTPLWVSLREVCQTDTPILRVQFALYTRETAQGFKGRIEDKPTRTVMPAVLYGVTSGGLYTSKLDMLAELPRSDQRAGLTLADYRATIAHHVESYMAAWANNSAPINALKDPRNVITAAYYAK